MRFLILVNESPWGGSCATVALRCARALVEAGEDLSTVFFSGDGIYNALPGALSDGGLPSPQSAWVSLADESGAQLLVCSAAAARRLDRATQSALPERFRVAGLPQLIEHMGDCDRVVTF